MSLRLFHSRVVRHIAISLPLLCIPILNFSAIAQAPAPASAATAGRQIGTVKSISGSTLVLATDAGQQFTIAVASGARILQLPPGSTDLKAAASITMNDIAVGDRVLVTGKTGEAPDQLTAARVILMKSTDIAQKRAADQADWQKRGSGGLVTAVDAATSTLTVASGAKKVAVKTSPTTIVRRYSGDSIKFEDAIPGTFVQIQVGDQLRVRGAKSEDGMSIAAEEIVSGSFTNLAGTIATLNAGDGTLTLKDLSTKKMMTVKVGANSDLRALPERAAVMFAARAKGTTPAPAPGATDKAAGAGPRGPGGQGTPGGGARSAGMDLSQMIGRLPTQTLADLKVGEAVMIVGSRATASSTNVTAVTLLTGVEPILAASPTGEAMTLSPWSVGGGAPDAGGSQ